MLEESLAPQEREKSEASSHIVHAFLQFSMAVRHRKNVVILCVFVAVALGAFYYMTATRLYSATAELLILASGDDTNSTGISGQGKDGTNLMPTFERVITSSSVIQDAIERLRPEDRIDLAEVPKSKWVGAIQQNLSAKSIYGTNNIEIEYLSRDPAAAVAVVNQIVQSYLELMQGIHKRTADDLMRRMQEQQDELNGQLRRLYLELAQKKVECGDFAGTDADGKTQHPLKEEYSWLRQQRMERQEEFFEARVKLAGLENAIATGVDIQPHLMAIEETVGNQVLEASLGLSSIVSDLRKKRLEDQSRIDRLLPFYGENHPEILELRSRIRAADQELAGSFMGGQDNAGSARTALGFMRQRVTGLAGTIRELEAAEKHVLKMAEGISGQLIDIQTIEREIEWCNQYRERLLSQLAMLSGVEDGPIIRAETVSYPVQALNPASPNLRRVGMLSLLAGLALGLAAVYVLDTLDDRFRSVEELQAQVGVPVMAIVQELVPRQEAGIDSLQLIAEPDAPESEAFRTLRTSLALTHEQSRRLVMTSAEPGDGKSTVLANMAVAYANSGKRTLLIDADLRRPGLSAMLGFRGGEGVSAVIRASQPVSEVAEQQVQQTDVSDLDVLPAGPRVANPAELLGSQRFADLLAWAEGCYDRVLIDSPPTLAASDTAVIGQLVDGVLMVVQPHKNQRRLVLRVAETLRMLKIPLIGLVANRVGGGGRSHGYGYTVDYSAQPAMEVDYYDYADEIDCPPEPTSRDRVASPGRNGGIDLSQLRGPRRRDAA